MRPSRQLPSWCGSGWVVNVRELSPLISCQLVRCRIMVPSILYCSAIVIVSVEYMHLFRRPTQSISRLFIVCQCQFMAVNIRSFLISVTHLYTSLYTQAMLALTHAQRCWQSRHIVHRVLREKMAESSLLRVCLLLLLQFCVERTRAHMIYQC